MICLILVNCWDECCLFSYFQKSLSSNALLTACIIGVSHGYLSTTTIHKVSHSVLFIITGFCSYWLEGPSWFQLEGDFWFILFFHNFNIKGSAMLSCHHVHFVALRYLGLFLPCSPALLTCYWFSLIGKQVDNKTCWYAIVDRVTHSHLSFFFSRWINSCYLQILRGI